MDSTQRTQISTALQTLLYDCDHTLNDLQCAQRTETMDASTSNFSFIGWMVSNSSYHQNMQAAHKVDNLRRQAEFINGLLFRTGMVGQNPYIQPLPLYFNGNDIRNAENAEHNFFANWMTDNRYSSYSSFNTMNQITSTMQKVQALQAQAQNLLFAINSAPAAIPIIPIVPNSSSVPLG